jgi:hypothetical protein
MSLEMRVLFIRTKKESNKILTGFVLQVISKTIATVFLSLPLFFLEFFLLMAECLRIPLNQFFGKGHLLLYALCMYSSMYVISPNH